MAADPSQLIDILAPPAPPAGSPLDPDLALLALAGVLLIGLVAWGVRQWRRWAALWRLRRLRGRLLRRELDPRAGAYQLAALLRGHFRLTRLQAERPGADPVRWRRVVQALDALRYRPAGAAAARAAHGGLLRDVSRLIRARR